MFVWVSSGCGVPGCRVGRLRSALPPAGIGRDGSDGRAAAAVGPQAVVRKPGRLRRWPPKRSGLRRRAAAGGRGYAPGSGPAPARPQRQQALAHLPRRKTPLAALVRNRPVNRRRTARAPKVLDQRRHAAMRRQRPKTSLVIQLIVQTRPGQPNPPTLTHRLKTLEPITQQRKSSIQPDNRNYAENEEARLCARALDDAVRSCARLTDTRVPSKEAALSSTEREPWHAAAS